MLHPVQQEFYVAEGQIPLFHSQKFEFDIRGAQSPGVVLQLQYPQYHMIHTNAMIWFWA